MSVQQPGPDHDLIKAAANVIVKAKREEFSAPGGWAFRLYEAGLLATPAIDVAHLARQAAWSAATFGPGTRTDGIMDHIRKEFREILAEPEGSGRRAEEWIDVVILALDGAWRSGLSPDEIIAAVRAKQAKNEARTWPDWRTAEPGKAIEHDRSDELQASPFCPEYSPTCPLCIAFAVESDRG